MSDSVETITADVQYATPTRTEIAAYGYSSLTSNDQDTRRRVFAATSDALPLSENLGVTIALVHMLAEPQQSEEYVDEKTGETIPASEFTRITLISEDGTAYTGTGHGLENAFVNVLRTLGHPSNWQEPEQVQVVERGKRPRAYYTIIPA